MWTILAVLSFCFCFWVLFSGAMIDNLNERVEKLEKK